MATYSSRGPVGDPSDSKTWKIKPDLVAPGNAIVSAGLPGTHLYDNYVDRQVAGDAGGTYLTLSGSSMATAVVSGAVALLLQAEPRLSPTDVKFALQYTAEQLPDFGLIDQGAGSVNVPLATALVVGRSIEAIEAGNDIAGETIAAGSVVFGTAQAVNGDGLFWGGRAVNSDGLFWGGRGVNSDGLFWGGRAVNSDGLFWGGRAVNSDGLFWGGRAVNSDGLFWGGRCRQQRRALLGRPCRQQRRALLGRPRRQQ